MKKTIVYLLIIFLAIIFQISLVPLFFVSSWPVDIVLMLILAWTLIDGFDDFLKWTIFIGIIYDLMTFSTVGLHVIVFVILSYIVSFFSKVFSVEIKNTGIFLVALLVAVAVIGSRTAVLGYEFGIDFISVDFHNLGLTLKMFFSAVFYNLIIFFILFFAINKIERFFYLKKN